MKSFTAFIKSPSIIMFLSLINDDENKCFPIDITK